MHTAFDDGDGNTCGCLQGNRFIRTAEQVRQIDDLLAELANRTGNGEIHLVMDGGKYKFLRGPIASIRAIY